MARGGSVIEYEDFRATLDIFAEMATDDVDIEFEIEKKPKQFRKKTKRPKNIKFTKMAELKEDENEEDAFQSTIPKPPHPSLSVSVSGPSDMDDDMDKLNDLDKLKETESIDLEDVEYDEEEDDKSPVLYQRSIRVTKRTVRSKRFDDMGLSLFSGGDDDDDHEEHSSSDHDGARESMFGKPEPEKPPTPNTPGIILKKQFFKIEDENASNIGLKSMGRKKFANLLDDHDSD